MNMKTFLMIGLVMAVVIIIALVIALLRRTRKKRKQSLMTNSYHDHKNSDPMYDEMNGSDLQETIGGDDYDASDYGAGGTSRGYAPDYPGHYSGDHAGTIADGSSGTIADYWYEENDSAREGTIPEEQELQGLTVTLSPSYKRKPMQPITVEIRQGDECFLGRDYNNDICFADLQTVSARHAMLYYDGTELSVADSHSRNGTFLNQKQLDERFAVVKTGDVVGLGRWLEIKVTVEETR